MLEELKAQRDERNRHQIIYTDMARYFMQVQNEYKGRVHEIPSGMEWLLKDPAGSPIFAPELEPLISQIMEKKTMEALEWTVNWKYEKGMPPNWPKSSEEFTRRL